MKLTDTDLLNFIANEGVMLSTGTYLCQAVSDKGTFQAYHTQPKVGNPKIHPSRSEALREAIKSAMGGYLAHELQKEIEHEKSKRYLSHNHDK